METDIPLAAVAVRVALLLISVAGVGFFAGSETACLAMDGWAVEGLKSTGDRRAALLNRLDRDSRSTISTLLIGTNVFTVLASVMGASLADLLGASEAISLGVVPLVITAMVFMFSELVPKTYASRASTEVALAVAPALSVLVAVLKPLSAVLSAGPNLLAGLLARKSARAASVSDEPVRAAVDLAEEEGQVDRQDSEVIVGVLDSSDTRVSDIMVPLSSVAAFSPDTAVRDALEAFKTHRFSRVPVVSRDDGQVAGVVYMKDVIREVLRAPGCQEPVSTLMRPPFTAGSGENLLDVLGRMRKNRVHLVVVMDGERPIGIVTLEDILEEIVGHIREDSSARGNQKKQLGV
jgi:CBS domain containing-hemolysin-like protein